MSGNVPLIVVAFKTVTLVIGGFITYTASTAARKTGWSGLRYLAVGFGVVTFGSLLAGVADQALLVNTTDALIIENALSAVGFSIIGYSLYKTQRSGGEGDD
ncbi:DUF7521 family protein [Halobaculum sp. D14]|uniref:DUF7521 family protein n=1 Tax=unclassified Halobaculum TaxID=2640896 RepID=UPI003EB7C9ED